MTRTLAILAALPLLACGSSEVALQAADADQRVAELEGELESLRERVLAVEGASTANATAAADAASLGTLANDAATANAEALSALTVRVDGHDAGLVEAAGALAGLESQLFDPVYGEIPRVDAALVSATEAGLAQDARIDVVEATLTSNTSAIATLGTTVATLDGVVQSTASQVALNVVEIEANRLDIDANAEGITANTDALASQQVALSGLTSEVEALDAAVAANTALATQNATDITANTAAIAINSTDIAQNSLDIGVNVSAIGVNTTDIAANASGVGANAADIGTNAADIGINTAAIATNTSAIGTNTADIAVIQTNTVAPVSDLLTYVSADTAADVVQISAADLLVDGKVTANNVAFRQCDGGNYSCTPLDCVALCQSQGERMATTDEVLAWASRGQNKCQWQWMLDRGNPDVPVRAFPMYFNRTTPGCGPVDTGDVPRFGGGPLPASGWDATILSNCACAAL